MAQPSDSGPSRVSPPKSGPLAGETLLLAADHYDGQVLTVLEETAKTLGAEVTTDREACSIMVINVHSPKWEAEREHLKYLKTSFPHLPQPVIRPYHWLVISGREKRVVEVSELPDEEPFMVNPAEPHYPVKMWCSKNISRHAGESAEDAHLNITRDLESVGAVTVAKRAHADVLIVDPHSKFYETVKREKDDHGRTWQKLATREWVEFCLSSKTVQLNTRIEDEEEGDAATSDGQDSFVEEEPGPVRTGPGRPTGKPRIEYSPEDDDFLCRWLAAFYPQGSWSSRKTFQSLAMDEATYPVAARHSSQSWQERFKKNAGAFSRRIRRLVDEGVNNTLKTNQERKAERVKRAKMAEGQPVGEPLVPTVDETSSVPPATTGAPVAADSTEHPTQTTSSATTNQVPIATTDPVEIATTNQVEIADGPGNLKDEMKSSQAARDDTSTTARAAVSSDTATGDVLVPETLLAPTHPEEVQGSSAITTAHVTVTETSQAVVGTIVSTISGEGQQSVQGSQQMVQPGVVQAGSSSTSSAHAQLEGPVNSQTEEYDVRIRPASELLGRTTVDPSEIHTPSPRVRSKKRRTSEVPAGSTPLREELERSREKRLRAAERLNQNPAHGPSSHRLSKRASSPDKVYAFVGLPPRPITPTVENENENTTPAPEPANHRTPPANLTPQERWESVQRGSRIVHDVAAQYRAKITALCQKFSIGAKEISQATTEMRQSGKAGRGGLDWETLEQVLAAKHGRS